MSSAALRELTQAPGSPCELCGAPVAAEHSHLVCPASGELLCSCRPCALLFSKQADQRYKLVPERPRALPGLTIPDELWARLVMPVRLAFFFRSGPEARPVGLYPSAAGALEAQLDPSAFQELEGRSPELTNMSRDVEALLANRLSEPEYLIAPIDRCYELVGILRTGWRGLSGGTEVWRQVTSFWERLREAARP